MRLLLLLLLASPVLAGGQRYSHDDRFIDAEFANVYRSIDSVDVSVDPLSVSSATITNLAVSVSTISTLTVTTLNYGTPVSYTPAFSSGWGTVANVSVWYAVIGRQMRIWGNFQCGTVAAAPGAMGLPSGYSIDTSNVAPTGKQFFGLAVGLHTGANANLAASSHLGFFVYRGDATSVEFSDTNGGGSNVFGSRNINGFFSTGEYVSFDIWVPVVRS
jgi:hypothetical protein